MNKEKKAPERSCIGCGAKREKKELLRVLRSPEGLWEIDPTGRKNGRGAYLCPDPEYLRKAEKRKGLQKSFRMEVPAEIYRRLQEELERLAK